VSQLAVGQHAGRVALVTGSGRRIGRAIADALAAEGAAVVINAKSSAAEADAAAAAIRARGGRAVVQLADVADPDAVARMVDGAVAAFGRLDILVNNAALRARAALAALDYGEWRRVVGTILDGAFLCARAAAPHLIAAEGTIVNIGGAAGQTGAKAHAHVVAAKAGLIGLTKALAHDLAPRVTVNCLSPGLIEAPGDDPQRNATRRQQYPLERIPVGRAGTPEDVARAVVALCGPGFRYMTGQVVSLSGGIVMP
jgi:3-oxoacyl-[acyl-carrier protein] reductase